MSEVEFSYKKLSDTENDSNTKFGRSKPTDPQTPRVNLQGAHAVGV